VTVGDLSATPSESVHQAASASTARLPAGVPVRRLSSAVKAGPTGWHPDPEGRLSSETSARVEPSSSSCAPSRAGHRSALPDQVSKVIVGRNRAGRLVAAPKAPSPPTAASGRACVPLDARCSGPLLSRCSVLQGTFASGPGSIELLPAARHEGQPHQAGSAGGWSGAPPPWARMVAHPPT
jgi:hypothetical protein